jgi:hypothetical protein
MRFFEEADETDLSNIESRGHRVTPRTSRDGQQLCKRLSILRAQGVHQTRRDVVNQSPALVRVVAIRDALRSFSLSLSLSLSLSHAGIRV